MCLYPFVGLIREHQLKESHQEKFCPTGFLVQPSKTLIFKLKLISTDKNKFLEFIESYLSKLYE